MKDKHFYIITHLSFLSKVEPTHRKGEGNQRQIVSSKRCFSDPYRTGGKAGSGNQTVDTPFLTTDTSQEKAWSWPSEKKVMKDWGQQMENSPRVTQDPGYSSSQLGSSQTVHSWKVTKGMVCGCGCLCKWQLTDNKWYGTGDVWEVTCDRLQVTFDK